MLALSIVSIFSIALASAPSPKKKIDCGDMTCDLFATPREAFLRVLESKPAILAIGEVHQTESTRLIASAISRFTASMLPSLEHRASDLIVETWITRGTCGAEETQAVQQIEETTERPAETEDEVVTLIKRANSRHITPHILELNCDQYRSLLDGEGELDSEKTLQLVTDLISEKAKGLTEKNQTRGIKRMVVIYGGAIHNDVTPSPEFASFSFAKALDLAADGHYVELDLYVPELIAGDESYADAPWYRYFERFRSPRRTLLIRTSSVSYSLIFPDKVGVRTAP